MLPTTIIETCWPTIEKFTDLESTISLSSTCRSLHSLIIVAATHKVKVTHFQVCNLPKPDNDDILIPRDYTTAHLRIPLYTSQALSHIHFPSLIKLHIDFPLSRRRQYTGDTSSDYVEDVHSPFLILASQLGMSASNKLKSLYLNCNRLMQYEAGGRLEATYEIFGQNLSRCCNELEELHIVNTGMVRGYNVSMYSVGLTIALASILKRKKDKIRNFEYEVCGRPLKHRQYGGYSKANRDLFGAVLQSTKLERLCIKCSPDHFRDFVRAVDAMERKATTSICDLTLMGGIVHYPADIRLEVDRITISDSFITQVCHMLDHFSQCRSLRRLRLGIPKECWREPHTLDAVTNLLSYQQDLEAVLLNFLGFDDKEGKVLKCMSDILSRLALNGCNIFRLYCLKNVDEARLRELSDCMEDLGFAMFLRTDRDITFINNEQAWRRNVSFLL